MVEIDGRGFEGAAADVTLAGLGWLAVYGSGRCSLRVSALPGVAVATRGRSCPSRTAAHDGEVHRAGACCAGRARRKERSRRGGEGGASGAV